MRKSIQRTITASIILSANVSFTDEGVVTVENSPLTVSGKISPEKALKLARKTYGETAQVTAIDTVEDMYEISVEDFLKHATKVVTPESQEVETVEEV